MLDGNADRAVHDRRASNVFGPVLAPVEDAVVTVNDEVLPHVGNGTYNVIQTGFVSEYRFEVTRGTDMLSATLAAPSDFTFTMMPDPPRAGEPCTITWTPSDPQLLAEVQVMGASGQPFIMQSADTGQMMLPAAAFPTPGTYQLVVLRNAYLAPGPTGSSSTLALARIASRSVQ